MEPGLKSSLCVHKFVTKLSQFNFSFVDRFFAPASREREFVASERQLEVRTYGRTEKRFRRREVAMPISEYIFQGTLDF